MAKSASAMRSVAIASISRPPSRPPPRSTLFPYTPLFRSPGGPCRTRRYRWRPVFPRCDRRRQVLRPVGSTVAAMRPDIANPDNVNPSAAARPVKVVVVDDDPMVRSALTMMLDGVHGLAVVAEVADGRGVPDAVAAHRPDVVLMDIRMPGVNGIEATRRLTTRAHAPAVVVLTTFDSDANVVAAIRAGATGFLLKDTPPPDVVDAVVRSAAGDPVLAASVTRRLMDTVAVDATSRTGAQDALNRLTEREREVAIAVAEGLANPEIGARLYLGVATVKSHVSSILTKLSLANRTQIALLARDAGLV